METHLPRFSLRRDKDFFRRAKRLETSTFSWLWEPKNSITGIFIVVAKKKVALAAERNMLKRRVRELLRKKILEKKVKNIFPIVGVYKGGKTFHWKDIQNDTQTALAKLLD